MTLKTMCLTGAAIAALSCGIVTTAEARSRAEEDAITRQLNLDQVAKAQAARGAVTTSPAMQDGQGGPELQGPPAPEEGMVDDAVEDVTPDVPDELTPPEQPAPTQPKPNPY